MNENAETVLLAIPPSAVRRFLRVNSNEDVYAGDNSAFSQLAPKQACCLGQKKRVIARICSPWIPALLNTGFDERILTFDALGGGNRSLGRPCRGRSHCIAASTSTRHILWSVPVNGRGHTIHMAFYLSAVTHHVPGCAQWLQGHGVRSALKNVDIGLQPRADRRRRSAVFDKVSAAAHEVCAGASGAR